MEEAMFRTTVVAAALSFSCGLVNASIATTTILADVTPPSPQFGEEVTLIAIVSPPLSPGFVSFLDRGVLVGTGAVNGNGIAIASTVTLSAGSHSLVAAYGGNTSGGFLPSQSAALPYLVSAVSSVGLTSE